MRSGCGLATQDVADLAFNKIRPTRFMTKVRYGEANEQLGRPVDLLCYRQCAEILCDLGLCQVRVTQHPLKLRASDRHAYDCLASFHSSETTEKAAINAYQK